MAPATARAKDPKPTASSKSSSALKELEQGYAALMKEANIVHQEATLMSSLPGMRIPDFATIISGLAALAQGKVTTEHRQNPAPVPTPTSKPAKARDVPSSNRVIPAQATPNATPPKSKSTRDVAEGIEGASRKSTSKATDEAVDDLANLVARERPSKNRKLSDQDEEKIRKALLKRTAALKAYLLSDLGSTVDAAFMHIEHEILKRKYLNTETMYGDELSEIPRATFFVSEDGYAWDMEELAQAITSNGGIMRNPLSKEMFNPADVRFIVHHPLGKGLAAMQLDQSRLRRGVREKTIKMLERLSDILLHEEDGDFVESRGAVEEFMAYLATLPDAEQKAIDRLRVPAVDSHTGIPFDLSIGEAVKDALAGTLCFHKTGDLILQATWHLRGR